MTFQVSPASQTVPSCQCLPLAAKPDPDFAESISGSATPSSAPPSPSSLEPSAARLLVVLTKIESAGLTVAGYLARLQAQRDALSVEIAEVESFSNLSEKFVPRTPTGRKRRADAGQPRKRRSKASTTTAHPAKPSTEETK